MLTVVLVASLAGGGTAAANRGIDPSADGQVVIDPETGTAPAMELSGGCGGGDDWSFDSSVD